MLSRIFPARPGRLPVSARGASAAVGLLLVGALLLNCRGSVHEKGSPPGSLRVTIIDRGTRKSIAVRCYLTDANGRFWTPPGVIHYAKPPEDHFITRGEFTIDLPPGGYTLIVEHGTEYRASSRQIEISSGQAREETVEVDRWIDMNSRGWYSGDLHNHRQLEEMPQLLLAEELNLAPTLTEWVWEDAPVSHAPPTRTKATAVRNADDTHVYSIVDTEIERLNDGPGAVDLVGLTAPITFAGYRLFPPNDTFAERARKLDGYIDAEKIVWRDVAALVALGAVDFAGIVHNHFNRHGVELETRVWGMIPKEKPEYETAIGMALWTTEVYYRFLNCGFQLPVSAGSASGVKASPLGFNRVYVHLHEKFGYRPWFRGLKEGRSFATNRPMLFLSVNGREPGTTINVPAGAARAERKLNVRVKAITSGELDRVEIVWKGEVIKAVTAAESTSSMTVEAVVDANETGWIVSRAFEKSSPSIRFAHTSPVYVHVEGSSGIVSEDVGFFLRWLDREIEFYKNLPGFKSESDRQQMLDLFTRARRLYSLMLRPGE